MEVGVDDVSISVFVLVPAPVDCESSLMVGTEDGLL